jgi:hypothetical protein
LIVDLEAEGILAVYFDRPNGRETWVVEAHRHRVAFGLGKLGKRAGVIIPLVGRDLGVFAAMRIAGADLSLCDVKISRRSTFGSDKLILAVGAVERDGVAGQQHGG